MLMEFDSIRSAQDLGGAWEMREDPTGSSVWFTDAQPEVGWRKVSLPADIAHCIPERPHAAGVYWFRRRIRIPGTYCGRRVFLRFDAVNYDCSVFIGESHICKNEEGFLPFEAEITDFVRPGCEETLSLRVDTRRTPGQLPTSFFWKNCGGIIRDITLYATGDAFLSDAYVTGDHLGNTSLRAERCGDCEGLTLEVKITDSDGHVLSCDAADCDGNSYSAQHTLANISPWSPDTPTLYRAEFTLLRDGTPLDRVSRTFGFRTVEAKDGKILLNGKEIFLKGFNRHEDHPTSGGAANVRVVTEDFKKIKESGANFIRMCHYPRDVRELQTADRLGLCLLVEIPLCGYPATRIGMTEPDAKCPNEAVYFHARTCLERMIRRDRSHPSVIIWSVSNENEEPEECVIRNQDALIRIAKSMDPTRLATHVSNHSRHKERKSFFREDDVICFNTYRTIFGRIYNKNADFDPAEAGEAIAETVRGLRADFPDKPVIVTEYGYRTCDSFDGPEDEKIQAAAVAAEYAGARKTANGASVWLYADHLWPKDNGIADDVSEYGLLRRDRSEKEAFRVYAELMKKE
ncbi:MAG: hypothetical protein IKL89_04400 [Clostridia bacterium]|nr:hypothetical protein [Clostridia bacterium]